MKANFRCSRCKKFFTVGKKNKCRTVCPNCHNEMVITREEKLLKHKIYKPNFLSKGYHFKNIDMREF